MFAATTATCVAMRTFWAALTVGILRARVFYRLTSTYIHLSSTVVKWAGLNFGLHDHFVIGIEIFGLHIYLKLSKNRHSNMM